MFLKEKERQLLQDALNKEVMRCIIILQRWFRACLLRMHFLQRKDAAVLIQVPFIDLYTRFGVPTKIIDKDKSHSHSSEQAKESTDHQ